MSTFIATLLFAYSAIAQTTAGAPPAVTTTTTTAPPAAPLAAAPAATPTNDELRLIAQTAVVSQLVDPDSARFRWPDKPFQELTSFRPGLFAHTFRGDLWYGCGQFNARNRSGGYNGFEWFDVIVQNGSVVWSNLDEPGNDLSMSEFNCRQNGYAP